MIFIARLHISFPPQLASVQYFGVPIFLPQVSSSPMEAQSCPSGNSNHAKKFKEAENSIHGSISSFTNTEASSFEKFKNTKTEETNQES